MLSDKVVVVGINGQFGGILARKLDQAGADVSGLDLQTCAHESLICRSYISTSICDLSAAAEQLIANADFVFLCVPEDAILQSLPRLCDLMRPDALLMDIASVKSRICEALGKLELRCGYLSIHPMFGPVDDFSDQAVCLIHVQDNDRTQHITDLIATWGARVSTLTAERHDAATALVQAMPHAALIAFGAALEDSGVTFDLLWNIATPIQRIMLALATRVASGEHDTYWSIQTANPFAGKARDKMAAELRTVSSIAQDASFPDFTAKLDAFRRYLGAAAGPLEALATRLYKA